MIGLLPSAIEKSALSRPSSKFHGAGRSFELKTTVPPHAGAVQPVGVSGHATSQPSGLLTVPNGSGRSCVFGRRHASEPFTAACSMFSMTTENFFMPGAVMRAWMPPSITCVAGTPKGVLPAGNGASVPQPPVPEPHPSRHRRAARSPRSSEGRTSTAWDLLIDAEWSCREISSLSDGRCAPVSAPLTAKYRECQLVLS